MEVTGIIYRQFSITIISSMVLSVIVALTLTPALCSTILKPHKKWKKQKKKIVAFLLVWYKIWELYKNINFGFEKLLYSQKSG